MLEYLMSNELLPSILFMQVRHLFHKFFPILIGFRAWPDPRGPQIATLETKISSLSPQNGKFLRLHFGDGSDSYDLESQCVTFGGVRGKDELQ